MMATLPSLLGLDGLGLPLDAELRAAAAEARLRSAQGEAERSEQLRAAGAMEPIDWQSRADPNITETETIAAGVRARRREASTPLRKYVGAWHRERERLGGLARAAEDAWRLHDREPRQGISPLQCEAGEQFAEDCRIAYRSLGVTAADLLRMHMKLGGGVGAAAQRAYVEFRRAHRKLVAMHGEVTANVAVAVCAHEETLRDVERRFGWGHDRGHAMRHLRLALATLAGHYAAGRGSRQRRRKPASALAPTGRTK